MEPIKNLLLQTQIEELDLSDNKFGDKGFKILCSGLQNSSVKKINLENCGVTTLNPLESIFEQTKIQEINFDSNGYGNLEFAFLCLILPKSNVKTLCLREHQIISLKPIKNILSMTKIEELDLSCNPFGNQGFEDLCRELPNSNVKILDVSFCDITSFQSVKNLLSQTKIEELNLNFNGFGDEGFKDLCSVLSKSKIQKLEVYLCDITDRTPFDQLWFKSRYGLSLFIPDSKGK